MATHSSVLAWRIPGVGKSGGLPSMRSHRVGHDWSDLAARDRLSWVDLTWTEEPFKRLLRLSLKLEVISSRDSSPLSLWLALKNQPTMNFIAGKKSDNNIRKLGVDFSPQSSLQMRTSPVNTLIAALWDSKQRNHGSHAQMSDLQKLWANKLMSFSATQVVIICSRAKENQYTLCVYRSYFSS